MTIGGHHVEILLHPTPSEAARSQAGMSGFAASLEATGGVRGVQVELRVQGLQVVASGSAHRFLDVWASLVRSYEERLRETSVKPEVR